MKAENLKEMLRKVQALAEKGYKGEKEQAQRTIDKLLKKYNMTLSDVYLVEERLEGNLWQNWKAHLACAVATNCGCAIIYNKCYNRKYSFRSVIGEEVSVAVCKELLKYLEGYVTRIAKEYAVPRKEIAKFKESIVLGIIIKLRENEAVWLDGKKQSEKVTEMYAQAKKEKGDGEVGKKEQKIHPNSKQGIALGYEVNLAKQAAGVSVDREQLENKQMLLEAV